MGEKKRYSIYAVSKLTVGEAWDAANQTKKPYNGNFEYEPDMGPENLGVLTTGEGDCADGFVNQAAIGNITITQTATQDDMDFYTAAHDNGYYMGFWYSNKLENVWAKGYITELNVKCAEKGNVELTITAWCGKPAAMAAPSISLQTLKPLLWKNVYMSTYFLRSIDLTIKNSIMPIYGLEAGTTDIYPNTHEDIERFGEISFVCETDDVQTFSNPVTSDEVFKINDVDIHIGTTVITMSRLVIDAATTRSIALGDGNFMFDISGKMGNDGSDLSVPYVIS